MKKLFPALALLTSLAASAAIPPGWIVAGSAPTEYEFDVDTSSPDGSKSAFIKAKPSASSSGFGTLMQMITAEDYRGGRWKLTARMRTDDAVRAQMWMRVDGPDRKMQAFDNMESRPVSGDSAWKTYEIVLDVPADAGNIAFGFFLMGGGQVWADDFKLEKVPATTPVTAPAVGKAQPRSPVNADFNQ
jgi:hypothetical protein